MFDENQEPDENRELRRKRRKKNQIKVYICLILALLCIAVLGFIAVKEISDKIAERKQIRQEAASLEELEEETEEETETDEIEETTEEAVEEYTEEQLLDEIVQTCIADMPLEDKVAGLFVVTPEALTGVETAVKAGNSTKEALLQYPVGGLIYFKKNIQSREQIANMLGTTVSMSKYPVFLAVDEEGGTVARAADALGLEKTKDAIELGKEGNPETVREAYQKIGKYLCELGFNVNFAPVADVLSNPENTVIEKRAFGTGEETVSRMVSAAVDALEEEGITSCLKHFPGQGNGNLDTHETLATSNRTLDELRELELKPFQAGIEAGAQMVMVGHFAVPEVTGEGVPASLSKEIMTDLLRDEMGFEGVIITDALNMGAISEKHDSTEACIQALEAGADLLLMPEDFKMAYEGVLQAVKDGKISEARIDDSLTRIYRIKYKNAIDN